MELEVSHKVRAAIKAKLVELGVHVDEELPDYIMVLIANRRAPPQMESDLNLFLGDQTHRFVSWLTLVLKKLEQVTAAASTTPTTPTPPVEPTPVVSSKKRKSSNKEPEGDGGGSSSSTEDKSSPVKSKKKKQDSPVVQQQEDQPKESSPPRQSSKDKEPEESCSPKKTHEDSPQPDKDLEKMRNELLKSKKSTSNSPPRANHSKSPQNKPTRNKSRSRSPIRRHHNTTTHNRERTLSTRSSSNKHTRSRSRSPPPQQPPSKYTPRTSVFQRLLNRNRRSRSRSRSPPQPVPQRKTLSSIVVKKKIESIIKQNDTTKKLPSQVVKIGQPRTRPMITIDSSSSPPKPSKLLLRAVSEANKDALSSHGDKIISRIEVDKKVEMKLTGKETGSRRSRDDDGEVRSRSNNYDDDVDLEYKVSRSGGSAAPAPQFLEFNRRVVNNNRVVVGDEASKPRKSVLERLGKRVVNYHHHQQRDGSRGRSVLDRLGEREGLFENIVVRVDGGGGCDDGEDDDEGEEEGDVEDDVFGAHHQQLRAATHSPSSSTASGGGLPGSLALKHDSSNRIQRISIPVNDDDTSEDEDDESEEEDDEGDKQINNNQDNNETHTNDSKHKVNELEEQEDVIVLQEGSPIRDEEVVDDDEDDTRKSVSSYDEVVEEVIDDDGEDSLTGKKTKTEDEDMDSKKLVDLRERIVKKQVSKKKALEEDTLSSKIDKVRETVSSISFDDVFSLVPPIQHSSSTVTCKYWPNCSYKSNCVYNHPVCKYNPCTNENCAYKHVGSQQKKVIIGVNKNKGGLKLSGTSGTPSICKFFPKCHNLDCKFYHPTPCRFGLGCKDKNCKYFHPGGKVMGGSSSSSLPHKSLLKWEKK